MLSETEHQTLASRKAGAPRETWHAVQPTMAPDGHGISCRHILKGVCCTEPHTGRCPRQQLTVTAKVFPVVEARVTAENASLLRSHEMSLCAHPCATWLQFLMYIRPVGIAR